MAAPNANAPAGTGAREELQAVERPEYSTPPPDLVEAARARGEWIMAWGYDPPPGWDLPVRNRDGLLCGDGRDSPPSECGTPPSECGSGPAPPSECGTDERSNIQIHQTHSDSLDSPGGDAEKRRPVSSERAWKLRKEPTPAPALDLPEFAADTLELARQQFEAAADTRGAYLTLPFAWAGYLRAHPDLEDLDGFGAAKRIAHLLPELADPEADPTGEPWVDALGQEDAFGGYVEPESAFVDAWAKVRPRALSLWDEAQARAQQAPLEPPKDRPETYVSVVSLCYHLASLRDGTFHVSTRQAGAWAGIDQSTAARWLRIAQAEGLITRTSEGSLGRRRAAGYKWTGEVEP